MPKESTKYQLLKADFDQVCKDLKNRRLMIEQLREEKKQAYYEGYKQGRYDEKMNRINQVGYFCEECNKEIDGLNPKEPRWCSNCR